VYQDVNLKNLERFRMPDIHGARTLIGAGATENFSASGKPDLDLFDFLKKSLDVRRESTTHEPRLVCIDYDSQVRRLFSRYGLNKGHSLLIRTEPTIVLPKNYWPSTQNRFGQVLTLGGDPSVGIDSLPWPQVWPETDDAFLYQGKARQDKIVSISGNKLSLISGELYSLRRKCIQQLSDLVFFGKGWDLTFLNKLETALKAFLFALISWRLPKLSALDCWFSRYPRWGGAVDDKRQVMSDYNYALVIENSLEYVSEKLFDAFFAGCIPIYVGPLVSKYGIPQELVIQADPDLESIRRAIESARSLSYEVWFSGVKSFLESESTRTKWSHEHVYQEIADRLLYTCK